MPDITTSILYYTSNREPVAFESRIRQHLLDTTQNAYPIVSVSHTPIADFGTNICIGHHAVCGETLLQQLWIGLQHCHTPYVAMAEADFLYPPEYFTIIPPTDICIYEYVPIYMIYLWHGKHTKGLFWHKNRSEGARVATVQAMFDLIDFQLSRLFPKTDVRTLPIIQAWMNTSPNISRVLEPSGRWTAYDVQSERRIRRKYIKSYAGQIPAVTARTKYGMSNVYKKTYETLREDLPYWGNSHDLRHFLKQDVPEFADIQ